MLMDNKTTTTSAASLVGAAKIKAAFEPVTVYENGEPRVLGRSSAWAQAAQDGRVAGTDHNGDYVVMPLGNRNGTFLAGHVFLVSPADEELARAYNWCGHVTKSGIELRRRESVGAKQVSIMFRREITARVWPDLPGRSYIYAFGHTLDMRRGQLGLIKPFYRIKSCRGVCEQKKGSSIYLQVQKSWTGKAEYIGFAPDWETGYRMFNDALRADKIAEKDNSAARIHFMPYNDIEPMFTDGTSLQEGAAY